MPIPNFSHRYTPSTKLNMVLKEAVERSASMPDWDTDSHEGHDGFVSMVCIEFLHKKSGAFRFTLYADGNIYFDYEPSDKKPSVNIRADFNSIAPADLCDMIEATLDLALLATEDFEPALNSIWSSFRIEQSDKKGDTKAAAKVEFPVVKVPPFGITTIELKHCFEEKPDFEKLQANWHKYWRAILKELLFQLEDYNNSVSLFPGELSEGKFQLRLKATDCIMIECWFFHPETNAVLDPTWSFWITDNFEVDSQPSY